MVRSGSYLVAWIIELLVGGIASEATRGRSRGDRNTFFTPTWGNPPSSRYLRPDASGPKEDSSIRSKSIEANPFRMGEMRSRAKLAGFCRWGWSGFLPLKVAGFHAAVNTQRQGEQQDPCPERFKTYAARYWRPDPLPTAGPRTAGARACCRRMVWGRHLPEGNCYEQPWWRGPELNWGHEDFQSTALPTELPRHDGRVPY